MSTATIIPCSYEQHADQILDIFNDAIKTSTALFDYKPRQAESMIGWFEAKVAGNFPVIGMEQDGQLVGFASYGTFRAWPAYQYTVEHSVYVHKAHRGKGIGKQLMKAIIEAADKQGVRTLIAGIEARNQGSIALHEALGFEHCGTIKDAGYKFGRWLDLAFYQKVLDGPASPTEVL